MYSYCYNLCIIHFFGFCVHPIYPITPETELLYKFHYRDKNTIIYQLEDIQIVTKIVTFLSWYFKFKFDFLLLSIFIQFSITVLQ